MAILDNHRVLDMLRVTPLHHPVFMESCIKLAKTGNIYIYICVCVCVFIMWNSPGSHLLTPISVAFTFVHAATLSLLLPFLNVCCCLSIPPAQILHPLPPKRKRWGSSGEWEEGVHSRSRAASSSCSLGLNSFALLLCDIVNNKLFFHWQQCSFLFASFFPSRYSPPISVYNKW